jgi:hypothetical protein
MAFFLVEHSKESTLQDNNSVMVLVRIKESSAPNISVEKMKFFLEKTNPRK